MQVNKATISKKARPFMKSKDVKNTDKLIPIRKLRFSRCYQTESERRRRNEIYAINHLCRLYYEKSEAGMKENNAA